MSRGWIGLNRTEVQENPFYFQEPFDKFHCFLDLLVLANHTDSTFEKKGVKVTVRRGQVARSLVELADRWRRDRKSVRKIIFELKTASELDSEPYPKKNPVTTIITLFRYDYYVKKFEGKDTERDSEIPTERDSEKDTYNNVKEFQTISNNSGIAKNSRLRAPGNGKIKNPLNWEKKKLAKDILAWAYDPANKFKIEKSERDTKAQIENTVRAHGWEEVWLIFNHCSEDRLPYDKGRWGDAREGENVSAYSEFWERVRGLKI